MATKKAQDIVEQIKTALNGRTQRWLATNTNIPEVDISRRLNRNGEFTWEEVIKIEKALDIEFKK